MAKKKKYRVHLQLNTVVIIVCFAIVLIYVFNTNKPSIFEGYEYVEVQENYGKEIDIYCSIQKLPSSYFKALAILECSGKKNFPHRFEPKVYSKLLDVKNGNRNAYENITKKMLENKSIAEIRKFSTSWGPFQIMGYKCIELSIKVEDLSGEDAVFWGITWINKTYGNYLRNNKFKDAFHIHNTGHVYPADNIPFTHNPFYVENGLKYMAHF